MGGGGPARASERAAALAAAASAAAAAAAAAVAELLPALPVSSWLMEAAKLTTERLGPLWRLKEGFAGETSPQGTGWLDG